MDTMSTTRITWRDAQLMPEDGKRYEAIDGELYVTPAPVLWHQWIGANLEAALRRLLMDPGHGWVFDAPVGVEFPETEEGVQPDIVFVSKARAERLVKEGIRGAPDLVVETLSPGTAARDRTIKLKLYRRQGVLQYWIVDPDTNSIELWDFAAGASGPQTYTDSIPVALSGKDFGKIDLSEVFPPDLD
ncbi:MAG: Uma2 family endonuclease [Gemmatimonadota bacterium]|nr:MAG: Uma2 family endonuclease [Gemmatimonadota bacterium]